MILTDNSPMPFGKHKGTAMANVPSGYLLWLVENAKCSDEVRQYVEVNREILEREDAFFNKKQIPITLRGR